MLEGRAKFNNILSSQGIIAFAKVFFFFFSFLILQFLFDSHYGFVKQLRVFFTHFKEELTDVCLA